MSWHSAATIKTTLRGLRRSTFFMNALYLMLSTFAVAGFGFIFWVIVTRTYATTTVGLAVTLLSVSGLLSMLSLGGFDTTFVRFLPKSDRRNDHINSGLIIVTLTSIVLSLAFMISLPITSPRLAFVLHNPWYLASFIFFTAATSLNVLTNSIFLAFKRARNIFVINLAFSAVKVALPLLVTHGSVMTIFVLVGISQLVGLVVSLAVMKLRLGYVFTPKVHLDILRVIKKYSLSVYASSILNLLPPTLLPLIVVRQLGPENAAYYYMAFTIASVLYTISYASMQSAFAEGSHNESALKEHVVKAAKLIGALLIPAIVVIFVLSGFILRLFGSKYAAGGDGVLRIFAVGALPVAVCSAMGAIFKVTKNLRGVVVMNVVYAVVILSLSYTFVSRFGVVAVGWAWMIGNVTAAGAGLLFLRQHRQNIT